MSDQLITTSSSEGLQVLGSAAQRSWEMITGLLREHLDAEAARLFAEPVAARHGGLIEWYAPEGGHAQPLSSLSPAERSALAEALAEQEARITALAERLTTQQGEKGFWQAEALRNALSHPSDTDLWALRAPDGRLSPLLINWSRLPDDSTHAQGGFGMRAAPPKPALANTTATTAPPAPLPLSAPLPGQSPSLLRWLLLAGWLLLALMIALILWLLIAPCALRPLLPGYCEATERTLPDPRAEILAELSLWEQTLAGRARDCRPTPPPVQADMRRAIDDLDRRLTERGAQPQAEGDLTVSLVWSGLDDLDLEVQCPGGGTINWRSPRGACGGELDIDANFPRDSAVEDPVENITLSGARPGRYQITVARPNDVAPKGPETFAVILRQTGKPDQTLTGTVYSADAPWAQEIEITP